MSTQHTYDSRAQRQGVRLRDVLTVSDLDRCRAMATSIRPGYRSRSTPCAEAARSGVRVDRRLLVRSYVVSRAERATPTPQAPQRATPPPDADGTQNRTSEQAPGEAEPRAIDGNQPDERIAA
jgi:hypothetical protein